MAVYGSFIICTSPRSGSTLLCRLLAATGVAGRPASFFYDLSVPGWAADLGLSLQVGESEAESIAAVLVEVLRKGRGGTGIFGLRQQAPGLTFLCEKLAVLFPTAARDADRFRQAFGTTLFVHLTRPDKVAQAVSLMKAMQSGLWHVAPDGSEIERTATHSEPVYDGATLKACVAQLTDHDQHWNDWSLREGINPLRLFYDDLAADPLETLCKVLDQLGLDRAAASGVMPGVKKLADQTSLDWADRFRAEHGLIHAQDGQDQLPV